MNVLAVKRLAAVSAAAGIWLALAVPALAAPISNGPPYPDPVLNQAVYDYASIFDDKTVSAAEATIDAIEERTGAEIVVYTQVKPESYNLELANADALALMNQWGVGRKGFDDGLVVLFDMQPNMCHGQISLYAGAGYEAAFLSRDERQAVFDDDMMPFLRSCDMSGALNAAMVKLDQAATPEHAAMLERGRQIGALLVVGALLSGMLLILFVCVPWALRGRDPGFLDDPSIYLPAPPEGLTPAMATLLLADRTSNRTVSAALVDLAAQGWIRFVQDEEDPSKAGIQYTGQGDPAGRCEHRLLDAISDHAGHHDGELAYDKLYVLANDLEKLKSDLEKASVDKGWLVAEPSKVTGHWYAIGGAALCLAVAVGLFWWIFFPTAFLFTLALSLGVAGVVTMIVGYFMPARTHQGAMLAAMLNAYKRTLVATIRQSQSMNEVVARKPLPWVETPDQEMAWGVAFGLDKELAELLERSMTGEAATTSAAGLAGLTAAGGTAAWTPSWWSSSSMSGGVSHAGGISPGLFSSGSIPNPGAIFSALGSIGSAPSPSSSSGGSSGWSGGGGGGGGFGGGGGGGGGGAGGGF